MAVRSVLIVDDDSGMAETLADILSVFGYAVTTAVHGADALDALARAPVDLIVGQDLSGTFGVGGNWTIPAYAATAGERTSTQFAPAR